MLPTETASLVSVAVFETVAVLACVVLAASLTWTVKAESIDLEAFSFGAVSISGTLGEAFDFFGLFSTQPEVVRVVEPAPETGIVILENEVDVAAVREAFSDEVSVEILENDLGSDYTGL